MRNLRLRWIALAATLAPLAALAGRPLVVDDAGPVAPRMVEIELGAAYFVDARTRHWHFPLNLAETRVSMKALVRWAVALPGYTVASLRGMEHYKLQSSY